MQHMPEGEMADIVRSLLLLYTNDQSLRDRVREYRIQTTQGWQQP
jgi:rRNA-processing protein FCF1